MSEFGQKQEQKPPVADFWWPEGKLCRQFPKRLKIDGPTMAHWLIQPVFRDPRTKRIVSRGRPKTVPPDLAAFMVNEHPDQWDVLDDAYPVPLDTRGRPGGPKMKPDPTRKID